MFHTLFYYSSGSINSPLSPPLINVTQGVHKINLEYNLELETCNNLTECFNKMETMEFNLQKYEKVTA